MIIYTADIHLTNKQPTNRITDIVTAGLKKLEYILSVAYDHNASVILGGDLFNGACPSYDLLTAVIALIKKYPVYIYGIYGNHDVIQTNILGDNAAIHALTKANLIKHLSMDVGNIIDDLCVYGMDYTKEMPNEVNISRAVPESKKGVLVTHLPLFPNKQVFDTISIADFRTNATTVLCSHIHNQFDLTVNGVRYINPGPVCRLKRTEKDLTPSFYQYDNGEWTKQTIPHETIEFRAKDECPDDVEDLENYAKIETQDVMGVLKGQCASDAIYDKCVELIGKHKKED